MKNEGTFVPQHYLFRKANFSESVLRGKMFALRKKAMFKDKHLRKFLGLIANGGYCIYGTDFAGLSCSGCFESCRKFPNVRVFIFISYSRYASGRKCLDRRMCLNPAERLIPTFVNNFSTTGTCGSSPANILHPGLPICAFLPLISLTSFSTCSMKEYIFLIFYYI